MLRHFPVSYSHETYTQIKALKLKLSGKLGKVNNVIRFSMSLLRWRQFFSYVLGAHFGWNPSSRLMVGFW